VLCQRAEEHVYVYDMAVREVDLLSEAAKGRFELRPSTIEREWKNVVKEQLPSTNLMVFACAAGAFDLWTLKSAKTSGERVLWPGPNQESCSCRECLNSLVHSVQPVGSSAAKSYCKFLSGLYETLTNRASRVVALTNAPSVRIMLMSFASCRVSSQQEPADVMDRFVECLDNLEEHPAKSRDVLVELLEHTPGSHMFWMTLGEAFLKLDDPVLAASAFRNALRLKSDDVSAMDGLARSYDACGFSELAKGVSRLVYACSDDPAMTARSVSIMNGRPWKSKP